MSDPRPCPLCDEGFVIGDQAQLIGTPSGLGWAHKECLLRSVIGGIGHHEDHQLWCVERGDPDGGRTFRQSALEVDALVAEGQRP